MFSPALLFPAFRRPRLAFYLAMAVGTGPLCIQAGAQTQTEKPTSEAPDVADAPVADAAREAEQAAPALPDQAPAAVGNAAPIPFVPDGAPRLNTMLQVPEAGTYKGAGVAAPEVRRVQLEGRLRDLMGQLGIVSSSTQDAILAFVSADEEGRRGVRDAGRKLLQGIRRDAPPERLKALLSEYQSAIDASRLRRERAQTALNAQVGYSLDARLESLLWLLGVLGQGQSAFGPGALGPGEAQTRRGAASEVQSSEIAGTITGKSGAGELPAWIEIRDEGGHLWRLKPDSAPAARQVMGRQINALSLGARITARVGTPVPIPVLLAIVPDDAEPNPQITP